MFATIVISVAVRITYLLQWSDDAPRIPEKKKADISRLFNSGAGLFALGFLVWNLDNLFCDALTKWKVSVGWPLAFLFEGELCELV